MAVEKMGIREFSRHVGVSDTSVRKAINSKKIPEYCIDRSNPKKPLIEVKKAMQFWGEKFNHSNVQSPKLLTKLKSVAVKIETPEVGDIDIDEFVESEDIVIKNNASSEEATRVKKIAEARYAQLELAEAKGKLVSKVKNDNDLFNTGVIIRTAILGIPDKHIDNILACSTRQESHSYMYKALVEALESLQPEKK